MPEDAAPSSPPAPDASGENHDAVVGAAATATTVPTLLPIIGTIIRSSASMDDEFSPVALQPHHSLRSWRTAREELISIEPNEQAPARHTEQLRLTVPTDVADVLEATLAGAPPRSCGRCHATCMRSRTLRVRAWCGCWMGIGASAGYFSLVFTNSLHDDVPQLWSIVGFTASATYTAVGVICTMSTIEMARAVGSGVRSADERPMANLDAGLLAPNEADLRPEQERGQERNNPSQLFLRTLLTSEISEAASQVRDC